MYTKSQKLLAEFLGTFGLVFFGCGTAIFGGDLVAISLAFGLSIVVAAYTIGKISGAHLNPAVSFAMYFDKRMSLNDAIAYSVAQIAGSVFASLCHLIIVACTGRIKIGDCLFGANMFGDYSAAKTNFFGALLVEIILTAVFVLFVLSVTGSRDEGTSKHAGLFIGLALTFVHLIGIPLTGTSVNPARSIGPAIFGSIASGGKSLLHMFIFIIGPMCGAFVAAFIYSFLIKDKDQ
ncbi:MAG: aquaporin [Ruminococcus sp.]|nr:aquaporin [Ruminococcus sp.]